MTRFKDKRNGNMGLSKSDEKSLFDVMRIQFPKLENKILRKISQMINAHKEYGLLEISEKLICSIFEKEDTGHTTFCIGYPFPIAEKSVFKQFGKYDVNLYIRDEPVRRIQRKYTFNNLVNKKVSKINKYQDMLLFRKELQKIAPNYSNKCIYVDLYDFIGDSIIGLYFLKEIAKSISIKQDNCQVYSKHYKHIPTEFTTYELSALEHDILDKYDNFTIIIPNLIDNQFSEFLKIMKRLSKKNVLIIVPSRNLFIEICNGTTNFHWIKSKDILFTIQPIDYYMDKAIEPFRIKNKRMGRNSIINCNALNKNVFINPFSSLPGKQITSEQCSELCDKLLSKGFKVFVSAGLNQDKYLKLLKSRNIRFIKDSGLKDLSTKLLKFNIGLVISTDSGISHMTAEIGIITVIVYNSFFWDEYSRQSFCNESLGGFCRAHIPMLPIVNNGIMSLVEKLYDDNQDYKLMRKIKTQINNLQNSNDDNVLKIHNSLLKTIEERPNYYDPEILLKSIVIKSNDTRSWALVKNVWDNFPIYKISRFHF